MAVMRTPDACFDNLPLWPYQPRYFTSTLYDMSVRLAYYDLGDAAASETLLLTHGMSAWSYLNRRLIPPLVAEGYRVVLFDQVGCGRSDKPSREEDYNYERHVAWNIDLLINHLRLNGVTVVLQDWGGLIGARVVAAHPANFRRLVVANTMLPTCEQYDGPPRPVRAQGEDGNETTPGQGAVAQKDGTGSDDDGLKGLGAFGPFNRAFYDWKSFAFRSGLRDAMWIKERGSKWPGAILAQKGIGPSNPKMSAEEEAAYCAPYPDDSYKAGARCFPELVPTPASDPTGRAQAGSGENNAAAWGVFRAFTKPVLLAFSDEDTVMSGGDEVWKQHCPGTRHAGVAHVTIRGVGHFLQDGGAAQLAEAIVAFVRATPPSAISAVRAKPY